MDVGLLAADIYDARRNGLNWANGSGIALGIISTALPFITGLGAADEIAEATVKSIGELRASKKQDAHHIIQDAAVRDVPGYSSGAAPGVHLPGPSTRVGSPHHAATQVQRQAGGGSYAAERRIGYKALRAAGLSPQTARDAIAKADAFFASLGVTPETPTRIPGNR